MLGNVDLSNLCQEILNRVGFLRFRALGSSMLPSIKSGDVISVQSAEPQTIIVGDVILYSQNERLYAHRVIHKERVEGTDLIMTKGDYLPSSASYVNDYEILGKVVSIERRRHVIQLDTPFQLMRGRFLALAFFWFSPIFEVVEWSFHLLRRLLSKANLGLNKFGLIRRIKRRILSQISYRMCSLFDVPSLAKFYKTSPKEILQEIDRGRKYYLAEKRGKVVGGFTSGEAWEGISHDTSYWIMGLFVVPRYRGAGVAKRLLGKAFSTLKEQGIDQIFVNVFENNIPAIKLYHKLGFIRADMHEAESKIDEHYAKVAPGSPHSLVLFKKV